MAARDPYARLRDAVALELERRCVVARTPAELAAGARFAYRVASRLEAEAMAQAAMDVLEKEGWRPPDRA